MADTDGGGAPRIEILVSHQAFPFLEEILAALTYLHRHLSPPGARPGSPDVRPRSAAGIFGVDGDDLDHLVRARRVSVLARAHPGEPDLAVPDHHALPVREQHVRLLGLHGARDVV